MGELKEFLRPQEIGWPFFIVMVAVVIGGGIVAVLGMRRFDERLAVAKIRYESNRLGVGSEAPEVFLLRDVRPDALMRVLGPLPGVLVTLGILGTFLGLGLAVGHAVPALAPGTPQPQVLAALQLLLKKVKFKFQISAWGISFSLCFTALNVLLERRTRSRLEEASSALQQYRKHLKDQLAEPMREGIERGFAALGTALQASLEQMATGASTLANNASELKNSVGALSTHVGNFGGRVEEASKQLVDSSKQLGRLGEKIDGSLQRMTTELGGQLKGATEKQQVSLDRSLQTLTSTLSTSLDGMGKQAKDAASDQKRAATEQRNALATSLTALGTNVRELRENLGREMGQLGEYHAKMAAALGRLDGTMSALERHNALLLGAVEKVHAAGPAPEPLPALPRQPSGRSAMAELSTPDDGMF